MLILILVILSFYLGYEFKNLQRNELEKKLIVQNLNLSKQIDTLKSNNLFLLNKIKIDNLKRNKVIEFIAKDEVNLINLKKRDKEYLKLISILKDGQPYGDYSNIANNVIGVYGKGKYLFIYEVENDERSL